MKFRQIAPGVVLTLDPVARLRRCLSGLILSVYARTYVSTYAGLASVMIALVFLNILASIFVFGGELNAAICRAAEADKKV